MFQLNYSWDICHTLACHHVLCSLTLMLHGVACAALPHSYVGFQVNNHLWSTLLLRKYYYAHLAEKIPYTIFCCFLVGFQWLIIMVFWGLMLQCKDSWWFNKWLIRHISIGNQCSLMVTRKQNNLFSAGQLSTLAQSPIEIIIISCISHLIYYLT